MLIHVKMTKQTYDTMKEDLDRPHPFAHERVGFMFTRQDTAGEAGLQILVTDYAPVPDGQYINDRSVGARINSAAIRSVMERALSTREGILHIHRHEHQGPPRFSRIDRRGLGELIPSFHNIGGNAAHGAMVFSFDASTGLVWVTKEGPPRPIAKVSIVGYPITIQALGGGIYV
jgi:hypothetical protein